MAVARRGLLAALVFCQQFAVESFAQRSDLPGLDSVAVNGSKAYEWLAWSTANIGHRLTGSEGGRKAESYASDLFTGIGADTVYFFPFQAQSWSRKNVKLIADGGPIETVSLANTPVDVAVTALLIDAGNGLPEDLQRIGDHLKGRIALINIGLQNATEGTRNLHRSEKTALAVRAGVAGIIFINQAEGHVLLTGTASIDGSLIDVPAVCVSAEDGAELRERLWPDRKMTVRIEMMNRVETIEARNVIAEIRGTDLRNEVVLIGGHLDSWDLATGATDNGLGAFSIIDMMRALKAYGVRPRRTIRFVMFMGEEQGLLGSRALVDHYVENGVLSKIRCMVNLDMSGNPKGFGVGGPEGWERTISDACHAVSSSLVQPGPASFAGEISQRIWLHSDHQPFLLKGIPIIYPLSDLGKHIYGCYHSSCDDIHLVDPMAMVNNVRTVAPLLLHLANAAELPPAFTEEGIRTRMIQEGLEEQLRIGGDWPW